MAYPGLGRPVRCGTICAVELSQGHTRENNPCKYLPCTIYPVAVHVSKLSGTRRTLVGPKTAVYLVGSECVQSDGWEECDVKMVGGQLNARAGRRKKGRVNK
jgi:hypothetical protein